MLGDNGIQRQMLSPLMLHVNLNITYLGSYLYSSLAQDVVARQEAG